MNQRFLTFSVIAMLLPAAGFGQTITADSPFQVRYAANLNVGGGKIDITNTGASGGNICVNVYTFAADEQLLSCCSCSVTPDGLASIGVIASLTSNTLIPVTPTSVVIKLLATPASPCNPSVVTATTTGMLAWGTTVHALPVTPGSPATTYGVTETPFTPATLSEGELSRLTSLCGFIQTDGTGFGICAGCSTGGQ